MSSVTRSLVVLDGSSGGREATNKEGTIRVKHPVWWWWGVGYSWVTLHGLPRGQTVHRVDTPPPPPEDENRGVEHLIEYFSHTREERVKWGPRCTALFFPTAVAEMVSPALVKVRMMGVGEVVFDDVLHTKMEEIVLAYLWTLTNKEEEMKSEPPPLVWVEREKYPSRVREKTPPLHRHDDTRRSRCTVRTPPLHSSLLVLSMASWPWKSVLEKGHDDAGGSTWVARQQKETLRHALQWERWLQWWWWAPLLELVFD